MKYFFLGALLIISIGCQGKTSTETIEIYNQDFTGDGANDAIQIVSSTIQIDSDFKDSYPHTFTKLDIIGGDQHTLLQIDEQGILVENGDRIKSGINSHAAYALGFGQDDFMYVVQIDNEGNPVSEPLTINWDKENQTWVME